MIGIRLINIRDIDLNLLVLFEAIYSAGNISRAAQVLDMNQPTVSNALTRLRTQLDDPLFVRDGKGVRPTERAEAIIAPIRRALQDIHSIGNREVAFDPDHSERTFRLHMIDVFEPVVMPMLAAHTAVNPSLSVKLLHPQTITSEDAVSDGAADLAIGLTPARSPQIDWEELCPLDVVVVARRDHPTLSGTISGPELMAHGHVSLDLDLPSTVPGARASSKKLVMKESTPFRQAIQVNRPSSIAAIVAKSDLIGLLPRFYVEALPDQGGLQILEPPRSLIDLSFFLIWHRRRVEDPGLVWLRNRIKSAMGRQPVR
ncbi:MAG: LysR family transcriptional regulator [Rhodobacteraceae bacterium]|jgi:DNA-binding transcriptional LysR family regulator|nr:LysR family transcriptional regulator [Paracoccaceae bacterium]